MVLTTLIPWDVGIKSACREKNINKMVVFKMKVEKLRRPVMRDILVFARAAKILSEIKVSNFSFKCQSNSVSENPVPLLAPPHSKKPWKLLIEDWKKFLNIQNSKKKNIKIGKIWSKSQRGRNWKRNLENYEKSYSSLISHL